MNTMRISSLILAALVTTGMTVGCSRNENPSGSSTGATGSTSSSSTGSTGSTSSSGTGAGGTSSSSSGTGPGASASAASASTR